MVFEIPTYTTKRSWLGELKSNGIDIDPTEDDMVGTMRKNNIESIFIELHHDLKPRQDSLILRVESVRSSLEAQNG